MADPRRPDAPEPAPGPAEAEDPLAADRRTLVVGGVAMAVLVLVGVVSAQLFVRAGCSSVPAPEPADPVTGAASPEDVIDEHLAPVDGARAVDIVEQVAGARVAAAVPVGEATGVAPLGDGLVTTGATVTSLDAALDPVATVPTEDAVVGDGEAVHAVSVANATSGHADAFVPLRGTDLAVGTCVDAAVVGAPFAYLLDAGDGQLLLFRAEEEGESPHLQLRGPAGEVGWDADLTLPVGPPGTLAERLTAELGPDTVVAARRVGPQEELEAPALVAVGRDDGATRFTLDGDELAAAAQLDPTEPIRWEVAAVGRTTVLVHGRPDPLDAEGTDDEGPPRRDGSLVLLGLADGEVVTTVTGTPPVTAAAADPASGADDAPDRYALALGGRGGDADEVAFLDAGGELTSLGSLVTEPRLAWRDEAVLVAARDAFTRLEPDDTTPTAQVLVGGRFADVTVTDDGRVAVLVTAREGEQAVLLVTGPTDDVATGG